jgi:hypothetical protein
MLGAHRGLDRVRRLDDPFLSLRLAATLASPGDIAALEEMLSDDRNATYAVAPGRPKERVARLSVAVA